MVLKKWVGTAALRMLRVTANLRPCGCTAAGKLAERRVPWPVTELGLPTVWKSDSSVMGGTWGCSHGSKQKARTLPRAIYGNRYQGEERHVRGKTTESGDDMVEASSRPPGKKFLNLT